MLTKGYETLASALRKIGTIGFSAMALTAFAISAQANLVTNGGFESTTTLPSANGGELGYLGFGATGWSTPAAGDSYAFLYTSEAGAVGGVNGIAGNVSLWGPPGSANGLSVSPQGGNFVAADSQYDNNTTGTGGDYLYQTVSGLTVGNQYTLTFYYAAAQQDPHTGQTQSGWDVSLGGQTQDAPLLTIPSEGFSGWQLETFTYTATATSETLNFVPVNLPAGGTGLPPFSLLDGVDLEATVPEPGYLAVGFGIMGLMLGMAVIRKNRIKA